MNPAYRAQVDLLIRLLPVVAAEPCFALKGGTAINLFIFDMPRLSVDLDLTYLPVVDRQSDLAGIAAALQRLRARMEKMIPGIHVAIPNSAQNTEAKLVCRFDQATVKIEVNTVIRGQLWPVRRLELSARAQAEFDKYAAIDVVSEAELFGGKLCAALDRQHPRDLFDVRGLLRRACLPDDIRRGFLALLLGHSRPIHELLQPKWQDARKLLETQFAGMTEEAFGYAEYEATREELLHAIHAGLTDEERELLLRFKAGEPDWTLFPEADLSQSPAVQWKLTNILQLRKKNPTKHAAQLAKLTAVLRPSG
jgi:predicted nucleotidyltransferase component of viral defense system